MPLIQITGYECCHCSHRWPPKSLKPTKFLPDQCPKCHRKTWNDPNFSKLDIPEFYKIPISVFVKSHLKAGHDKKKIYGCVLYLLNCDRQSNPKLFLEELWERPTTKIHSKY